MRSRMAAAAAVGASALLALSTIGVMAQSETEPCTGTAEFGAEGMTWTATDPRLTGDASAAGGWSLYDPPSEDAGVPADTDASYIIINEDGGWSCADSSTAGPEPDMAGHTLVFAGTGDYEGLTAHVRIDWSNYPFDFSGVIVESGVPEDPTLAG